MTAKGEGTERFSLKRWSQRKLESAAKAPGVGSTEAHRVVSTDVSARSSAEAWTKAPVGIAGTAPPVAEPAAPIELPPLESLTFDSDFTAFLRPEVEPSLQRAALKQLFRDPRFNVMDGLDTYIDDYTKPDPIPPDMLAELVKRFDFTPATPIDAPARAPDVSAESPVAAAPAPALTPTEPAAAEAALTAEGTISDATADRAGESTPSAPAETARESTVARDERR